MGDSREGLEDQVKALVLHCVLAELTPVIDTFATSTRTHVRLYGYHYSNVFCAFHRLKRKPFLYRPNMWQTGSHFLPQNPSDNDSMMTATNNSFHYYLISLL